ncbi:MAG: hypothetical protein KBF21_08655 [Thermoanaerobaculia bacterium]|nr:hypothetical protein [Thermoanaerobaculia bacterium]MBP9824276.1 hypothetical protein [Thermoanaerobaculia bacterium]
MIGSGRRREPFSARSRRAIGRGVVALLAGFAAAALPATGLDLHPVPLYGADIRSLVFDPSNPERAFAGTSAGHVYLSEDGGASFRNAGVEIPFPSWVVGTLVFDANRPERLWAGLWGIWGGGRVAFSDDRGATWTVRPGSASGEAQVYALATVPGVPDRLFAGTRAGVELSDDAGLAFRPVGRDLPGLIHVSSLHVDRQRPQIVVAGTWRQAYRSEDGGLTWRGVFDGMLLDSEVFSLHPAVDRPGELWASTCGWVYRGDGLGDKWTRFQTGLTERRTPSLAVLPGERLLAGTVAGAFLSTDRGASFRRTTPESLAVLAIAYHPAQPDRILIGTEGAGIWSSTDGGESFRARPVAMRNLRVPALDQDGDHLFAAVAHAGPASGVYRSPDGGSSFEPLPSELPTVLAMASTGERLFVATERGLFERERSREGGAEMTLPVRFHRVAEIGERRVEQLLATAERVVARTRDALFEISTASPEARFRPLALGPSAPPTSSGFHGIRSLRSVALAAGDLWVLHDEGLSRMVDGNLQAASLPFAAAPGSEIFSVSGDLHYSGRGGLFRRDTGTGAWMPLRPGPLRTIATGSERFPYLVEAHGALSLLALPERAGPGGEKGEGAWLAIDLPYPARETLSALVTSDRLLLGSSGFGVWQAMLPVLPPSAPVAQTPGEGQRSADSDARIRK